MARDRQRAKQRRRRQSADGEVGARPAGRRDELSPEAAEEQRRADARAAGPDDLDAAADSGVEDVVDDQGRPGETPAPDPLKHGSSWVDQAKLSEAGVEVDPPVEPSGDSRDEGVRYPDSEAGDSARERTGGNRVVTFLGHSAEELRRVQWPDRRQTGQGTAVVLGFVVLAGAFLGLVDAIWQPIIEAIL